MDTIKAAQTAAKKIAKSEKLFIVNHENKYYISDSFFMIVVNDSIYNNVFRTSDVAFCEVPEGKQASRFNKEDQVLQIGTNTFHVEQFFTTGSVQEVTKTRFFMNITDGKKEYPTSIFATKNDNFIVVNDKFLDYIKPFCGNDGFVQPSALDPAKESISPIYTSEWENINDPDFMAAAMILPVRNEIKSLDYTIARREAKAEDIKVAEKAEIKADAIIADAKREAARIIEEAEAIKEEARKYAKEIATKAKKAAVETIKTADQEEQQTGKPEQAKATIRRNEAKNGIEIYFNSFPASAIREQLKQNGYKWHSGKRCWYAKATAEHIAIAEQITGMAA